MIKKVIGSIMAAAILASQASAADTATLTRAVHKMVKDIQSLQAQQTYNADMIAKLVNEGKVTKESVETLKKTQASQDAVEAKESSTMAAAAAAKEEVKLQISNLNTKDARVDGMQEKLKLIEDNLLDLRKPGEIDPDVEKRILDYISE